MTVQAISPRVSGAGNTALVLEIVFGLFGMLGVGHAYSGRAMLGLGLLILWWVYLLVAATLAAFTFGLALCVLIPIGLAIPIISGIAARTHALEVGNSGTWGDVVLYVLAVGLGAVALAILIGAAVFGLSAVSDALIESYLLAGGNDRVGRLTKVYSP